MINLPRYQTMIDELEQYYAAFDPQRELFQEKMTKMTQALGDRPAMEQKIAAMRILAECSDIQVFRYYPFWFQFTADRARGIWGGLAANWGGMYLYKTRAEKEVKAFSDYFAADRAAGRIFNWDNPVGHDHHALNYDDILALGLDGLKARAQKYRANADQDKLPFYDAAIASLDILAGLSRRFAKRAEEMLLTETDETARKNLARIAATAAQVPMRPAKTFYEALAAIMFCRECVGTLEGIGVSVYGHLDRILQPYYEADHAAGRITAEEAKDLLAALFVNTGVRFSENTCPRETSTSIVLGGCDRDGNIVYNAVTDLILDVELEGRYVNLKLDCRISKSHPRAYLKKIMALQAEGLACIALLNDDVYISARVRQGQDLEDARLYVAGGCHEIVLGGTEVCTRADTWIILPGILMTTLKNGHFDTFEDLYRQVLADIQAFIIRVENAKNAVENHWADLNPMPLYSAMLTGCVEKGMDATAGGSKYANTALSMVSPATFIDSLWAIKTLCFDEKKYTLEAYMQIVENNFAGEEALRQYILNRIPKYCSGDDTLDAFTQEVFHALAQTAGQENGRGGKYLPAFYPHDVWRHVGAAMGATPDGRKAGFSLSRGCSPSEFLTGITPVEMLRSVAKMDFEEFADSFALEVTLPMLRGTEGENILVALVEEFLENKGATLQFNLLDAKALRQAQENPEAHRDIIVRVCGYSYYFVLLDKARQAEIISRAQRGV